jgi:hypothetical protein
MVGRPERSDPDELIYNLFHSSTREKGFNFVGYGVLQRHIERSNMKMKRCRTAA